MYSFFVWLLSLSIITLRFIHVVACITSPFLYIAEYYSTVWLHNMLLTHSSIDRNLDCFQFDAITKKVDIHIHEQAFM